MKPRTIQRAAGILALVGATTGAALAQAPDLQPLPEPKFDAKMAELGKYLFFDARIDAGNITPHHES